MPPHTIPPAARHADRRRTAVVGLAATVALAFGAGCAREDAKGPAAGADAGTRRTASASTAPLAPLVAAHYRAVETLGATGSVQGTITLPGASATVADSAVVAPVADAGTCGATVQTASLEQMGDRLGSVVVWLTGVSAGKRLSIARRYTVEIDRCRMTPRVQAALVGGTLNVRSLDDVLHHTTFVHQRDGTLLGDVTQHDAGQVVPVTKPLAAAGMIEMRCAQHPWERAWTAVFDHPYHAVTARDGAFALDSVPPGRYTLVAWHERLGAIQQPVTVAAGAPTVLDLRFGAAPPR